MARLLLDDCRLQQLKRRSKVVLNIKRLTNQKGSRRGLLSVFGLVLAFPVLAGNAEDDMTPQVAAQEWRASVEQRMSVPGDGRTPEKRREALVNRARVEGTVPVIVRIQESDAADQPEAGIQSQRAAKRRDVLGRLGLDEQQDRGGQKVKAFERMSGFALRADATDLADLMNDPEVLEVVEDVAYPPALLESIPLIGGSGGSFSGYTGQGQVVAILDTGVDKAHPLLPGKVVAEACYSTNYTTSGIYSLCPGSVGSSTATGAAVNCDANQWGSGCNHGTHVAGIVAGNNSAYTGVAKDAKLIAVQVFTGFTSASGYCGTGGTPCVLAYTSDIIRGLERVYAVRGSYPIAAANLSLGGGNYTSNCDGDAAKPAIDNLRAAGIATVVASGNSGYVTGLGSPACISSAISVGSSCDGAGTYCAATDSVASYSNSAPFLSLLAPGSLITSSVPGGGYSSWHGTSMATPHVAGAWALVKQAQPGASVDQVLTALKVGGTPVTDSRNGVTTPRIQPAVAIEQLLSGLLPPSPPTIAAPTNVTGNAFTANWGSVTGATGYRLDVSTSSSFATFVTGYQNLAVGPATSRTISGLSTGLTYYYRVRAYNDSGVSGNSGIGSATTQAAVPVTPTLSVATNITKSAFQVNWNPTVGASGYRLDVSTSSSFSTRLKGYNNLDVGNVTSKPVTGLKANTTYYVRLRAYSAAGVSPNSTTLAVKTLK